MSNSVVTLDPEDFEVVTGLMTGDDVVFVAILGGGRTTTEQVERYMPRGVLTSVLDYGWVAVVSLDWAQWLVDRLGSGLIVAEVVEDYESAQMWIGDRYVR